MIKSISIFLSVSLLLSLAACNLPEGKESQSEVLPTSASATSSPTVDPINQDAQQDSNPTDQAATGDQSCHPGSATLAMIVDPEILDDIRPGLSQFKEDLCQQGFILRIC